MLLSDASELARGLERTWLYTVVDGLTVLVFLVVIMTGVPMPLCENVEKVSAGHSCPSVAANPLRQ